MNTYISGNAIEGARFRVGGTTTTAFSKRLFLDGYLAYGSKDRKLKYDGIVEYSFIDKKDYRKEFPVHSIRFEYLYDINQLGQQYMYTNKDNMFLALKRQKDTRATYLRNMELTYYREHYNGWAYGAVLRNTQPVTLRSTVSVRMARSRLPIPTGCRKWSLSSVSPRMRNSTRLVITVIRLRLTHRYSP